MARHVYVYEGREFSSIRKLSEYVNVNEKTLTARLRKGMSVEEACQKADLRCPTMWMAAKKSQSPRYAGSRLRMQI